MADTDYITTYNGKVTAHLVWNLTGHNPRRYTNPWGGIVAFREDGTFHGYDFINGAFNKKYSKDAEVIIPVTTPCIVATGIKDNIKLKSEVYWYLVTSEGITPVSRASAYEKLQEAIEAKEKAQKEEENNNTPFEVEGIRTVAEESETYYSLVDIAKLANLTRRALYQLMNALGLIHCKKLIKNTKSSNWSNMINANQLLLLMTAL